MTRLPDLALAEMTDAQREVYRRLSAGPRQGVRGPFPIWLRAPELAACADALGLHCRFENGLSPTVNEAAVLATAVHWRSAFVFQSHVTLAVSVGLAESAIEDIRLRREPTGAAEDVQAACNFTREILAETGVSDTTWTRLTGSLGETGAVEFIGIVGYYGMACMTIKAANPTVVDTTFFEPTHS